MSFADGMPDPVRQGDPVKAFYEAWQDGPDALPLVSAKDFYPPQAGAARGHQKGETHRDTIDMQDRGLSIAARDARLLFEMLGS